MLGRSFLSIFFKVFWRGVRTIFKNLCGICYNIASVFWIWGDLPHPVEKEMATHSSTLAWKIPWIKEHARPLQSMGLQSQTRLSDFTHSLTPHPGIEPSFLVSPALAGEFFTTSVPWEALGRVPCKISRRGKKKKIL